MGIKNQFTSIVALKGLYILARSNAPGIKIRPICCPERAQQLFGPFRAPVKSYLYLRALPGVVLYLPFRQYLTFIESHQLQEAILLGHSDGATIALLYAAHFNPPGVVAIAPHIFVEDITLRGISKATLVKDKLVNKLRKYHGGKAEKLFNAWADTWLDPQFRSWTIQQELAGISCPLLLIQGAKDEYGSIHQLTGIQEAVPHAQIQLLPGLGHFPQFESPFDILQKIRAFLE
jgi:pimeloyl-ACP methyl ester carboxylesterase